MAGDKKYLQIINRSGGQGLQRIHIRDRGMTGLGDKIQKYVFFSFLWHHQFGIWQKSVFSGSN